MQIYQTRVLTAAAIFNESDWMTKKPSKALRADWTYYVYLKKKEREKNKKTKKDIFQSKAGHRVPLALKVGFPRCSGGAPKR